MGSGTLADPWVKDPDSEGWGCVVNWGNWLESGETIVSSSWSVTSPATDITIDSNTNDDTTATVRLSGGMDGRYYRLTNQVTTQSRTEEQSIWVKAIDQ